MRSADEMIRSTENFRTIVENGEAKLATRPMGERGLLTSSQVECLIERAQREAYGAALEAAAQCVETGCPPDHVPRYLYLCRAAEAVRELPVLDPEETQPTNPGGK